jgi:hypothetical protein
VTTTAVIYLIGACSAVFGITAFVGLIVAPAWTSYTTWWQRLCVSFLSIYVFAALLGLGALGGYGIFRLYTTYS